VFRACCPMKVRKLTRLQDSDQACVLALSEEQCEHRSVLLVPPQRHLWTISHGANLEAKCASSPLYSFWMLATAVQPLMLT